MDFGAPQVNFYSMLSGLGDTLQANDKLRQQQQIVAGRKAAFSDFTALDPASPDYGKQAITIAQRLGQAGDQDGAMKFLGVAQTAAERERQAKRDTVSDQHWAASFGLQQSNAARAQANADREWNYDPTDERTQQAKDHGLDPNSPATKAFILTGKLPGSDTAGPKAIPMGGALVDSSGKVLFKNGGDSSLDDDTASMMARQYLAGDRTVLQNLGRGGQGSANLVKLRTKIREEAYRQGLDGNAIAQRMIDYTGDTSRERTAATQEGRMAPAGIEAQGAIDLGRAASAKVPRTNWVPVNQALQAYQRGTSDPALRAFGSANTTIINTYARAINPNGVGTVADKEHAREMLSTADGPEAYSAVLDQLSKEIEMAHQSPAKARAGFKTERDARLNGKQPATMDQPNVTSSGIKWSPL